MSEPYVYVRLSRPDGYDDVHPELVIEDAHIHAAFLPADVTTEVDAALTLLRQLEWSGEAVAGIPTCPFCGCQRPRHATGDTLAGPRCRFLDALLTPETQR